MLSLIVDMALGACVADGRKLLSENERNAAMTQTTSSYTDLTTTSPFVLTLLTTPGSAALRIENSELPDPIQVDETEHREVTRRLGAGVQVYDRNRTAPSASASRRPTYTTLKPSPSEASTSWALSAEPHSGPTPTAAGWWPGWSNASMPLRRPIPPRTSSG